MQLHFSCKTFTIALSPRLLLEPIIVLPCFPSLHLIKSHWLQWMGSCWTRIADALSHDAELYFSSSVEPVWKAGAACPCSNTWAVSEKLLGHFGSCHGAGVLQVCSKVARAWGQEEVINNCCRESASLEHTVPARASFQNKLLRQKGFPDISLDGFILNRVRSFFFPFPPLFFLVSSRCGRRNGARGNETDQNFFQDQLKEFWRLKGNFPYMKYLSTES